MEFDKSKILTAVTADQAKVGMNGWFADDLYNLGKKINTCTPMNLKEVCDEEYGCRFVTDDDIVFALFYPAPEPKFKIGDIIKITQKYATHYGKVGRIESIVPWGREQLEMKVNFGACLASYINKDLAIWGEKVSEQTYRPFKNAEEFKPYRDEWFKHGVSQNLNMRSRAIDYTNVGVTICDPYSSWGEMKMKFYEWKEFFNEFTRENNEPCGIKE